MKINLVLELRHNELGRGISNVMENTTDLRLKDLIEVYSNKNKQILYIKILEEGRSSKSINRDSTDSVYLTFIGVINTIDYSTQEELQQIQELLCM